MAGYWTVLGFLLFALLIMYIANRIFPHKVTIAEICIGLVLQVIVVGSVFYFGMHVNGYSEQVLNGQVTSKTRETVSCSHSYECNCVIISSGSGKKRTTRRSCQTCYRHSNDFNWMIHSDLGEDYEVSRIDSQGTQQPNEWTNTTIGQPFSVKESYYNFIKGSPLSLFNSSDFESEMPLPYFNQVIGFTTKRVIDFNSNFQPVFDVYNQRLNEKMKVIGKEKKVNLSVIFHSQGQEFVNTFKAKNYGGEINDVIVMINADEDGKINLVSVFSYSKNDLVNVTIRDNVFDLNTLDSVFGVNDLVDAITDPIAKYYEGRSINEFKYLEDTKVMNKWFFIGLWAFGLLFPFVWSFIAQRFTIVR